MCRTSQALYIWCQCEESHVLETCQSGRSSPANCESVDSEVVYLHCFCHYHSTNKFTSIKKDQKLQRKAEKKMKNKRHSMNSATSIDSLDSSTSASSTGASSAGSSVLEKPSNRFRRSWNHLRRLSFA
uniref:Uncharacterized protein n=1 Tax=Talaromyces marneffei PM1 TaxID=1077442 RepID=A0A093UW37_TALMA